eukprot:SAG11_NODE_33478_length_277_cov_0.584270_1_plen_45_part_10
MAMQTQRRGQVMATPTRRQGRHTQHIWSRLGSAKGRVRVLKTSEH